MSHKIKLKKYETKQSAKERVLRLVKTEKNKMELVWSRFEEGTEKRLCNGTTWRQDGAGSQHEEELLHQKGNKQDGTRGRKLKSPMVDAKTGKIFTEIYYYLSSFFMFVMFDHNYYYE